VVSPWRDQRAAKLAVVEQFDNFAPLRNGLKRLSNALEHWAGIPMPLEGEHLVVEPNYPHADGLASINAPKAEPLPVGVRERNHWYSERLRCEIMIWDEGGKVLWAKLRCFNSFDYALHTLGCSVAWGIEQESNALQLLGTLLPHHHFKQYLLTGMFLETSKRSGLTYLFRKLRPTIVLDARDKSAASTRILCALCLHPIAYYSGSWAGAMCPTDDIIAHLMLMRGDEPMLWRRSNQHSPSRPEAGL
jgi:hypothetical protein